MSLSVAWKARPESPEKIKNGWLGKTHVECKRCPPISGGPDVREPPSRSWHYGLDSLKLLVSILPPVLPLLLSWSRGGKVASEAFFTCCFSLNACRCLADLLGHNSEEFGLLGLWFSSQWALRIYSVIWKKFFLVPWGVRTDRALVTTSWLRERHAFDMEERTPSLR